MISTASPDLSRFLVTFPDFLLYFVCAVTMLMVFLIVYTRLTPQHEWKLIREGNGAAAISLGAAMVGFCLPLASAISNSQSLLDMLVWGGVALVVQWGAFLAARMLFPGLPKRIEADDKSAGAIAASVSLSIGILNAACLTY
ncbi:DUF350 domain-containing protein [Ferrovibrio sp.]|uniref:DUF350 domain-containing protein n=1 Tax=Ferrovibrio sp. TaxID=1917215 RepID=UPI0025C54978|nr:DUF350 domain-containing protein [Ferrovibrio sp.]MBX3454965.1 DUF350 domain-containing protein [Ferrovibrio sp.]